MPAAYEGTNFISLSAVAENFIIYAVNYFISRSDISFPLGLEDALTYRSTQNAKKLSARFALVCCANLAEIVCWYIKMQEQPETALGRRIRTEGRG